MDLTLAARSVRIVRAGIIEERNGPGGGLVAALDEGGNGALAALFVDGAEIVELEDDAVIIRAERTSAGAAVATRWAGGEEERQLLPLPATTRVDDLVSALHDPSMPLHFREGRWYRGQLDPHAELLVPALAPEKLGAASFREAHGLRYAYIAGAMAGGIASVELVAAMARAGAIGFFGAGGLPIEAVGDAVRRVQTELPGQPAGFNLLHNPNEPAVEEATVDLYLAHDVRTISASAFMGLTPAVVRFRLHGIHEAGGRVVTPNRVLAKVSRPEVAEPFLRPAPAALLTELVRSGALTERQAQLAATVPVAEDITPEADSGGHTDRRPLSVLVPLFRRMRDRIARECGYGIGDGPGLPRIGAAGGLGDPWAVAGALALGADYVLTGSINQATVEAGTSDAVKEMLTAAGYADVTMGPAPDMFEIGAQVQVLSRGSMYAQRAARLYEIYKTYPAMEYIPAEARERIEKAIFQRPLDDVWAETEAYWKQRDPRELEKANRDSRHKMALCFRWYLGWTSRWARMGAAARKRDYQVWCGPAMGLFNDWVRGTWLEPLPARRVDTLMTALLHGACVAQRVGMVRAAGIPLPMAVGQIAPHPGGVGRVGAVKASAR